MDLGLQALKIGETARIPLADFTLEGSRRAELRQLRSRAARDGASFEILQPPEVVAAMEDLRKISNAWLAHKHAAEKRFSVGYFGPAYLACCPCAVIRSAGALVAFATLCPGGTGETLSVDLMRFGENAPKGAMDYLFVELMLWGKAQRYDLFDLGMVPLDVATLIAGSTAGTVQR